MRLVAGQPNDCRVYPLPDRSNWICWPHSEFRGTSDHRSHNPLDRNLHAARSREVCFRSLGYRFTVSTAICEALTPT